MAIQQNDQAAKGISSGKSRVVKVILTLCGLALLSCMVMRIGPESIWERLKSVDLVDLAGASIAIVAGTAISAVNSYLICSASRFMTFFEYLRAFWVAWAVGLIVPGQVGDMLTLTQVLRRHGMPLAQSVARTSLDKIVSLFCALLVASQMYRLNSAAVLQALSWMATALLIGLLVFLALSLWLLHHMRRFAFHRSWIVGMVATAAEVVHVMLAHPWLLLSNMVLSLVKVAVTGFSYWIVIKGLTGFFLSFTDVTAAAVSSGLVAYLPLSANGIGTVEAAGTGLFGAAGLTADIVLSMYVILRLVNMLLAWIPAIFILPRVLRQRKNLVRSS